jgi:hypothetical protein
VASKVVSECGKGWKVDQLHEEEEPDPVGDGKPAGRQRSVLTHGPVHRIKLKLEYTVVLRHNFSYHSPSLCCRVSLE